MEITPTPNETSMTDSGCEMGESRDVAVSLRPPAGQEVRESAENRDRGGGERSMLLGWLNLVAEGRLMSSPCQYRRSAGFLAVAVAAYPPGLSKVIIGVLGLVTHLRVGMSEPW